MGDRMASWKKKLTKENMAILALLGILLMVIALPVKKTENAGDETGLSDTGSDTMKTSETEKMMETEAIHRRWKTVWRRCCPAWMAWER